MTTTLTLDAGIIASLENLTNLADGIMSEMGELEYDDVAGDDAAADADNSSDDGDVHDDSNAGDDDNSDPDAPKDDEEKKQLTPEEKKKQKNAEKVKKILSDKNALESRVETLERENAIKDLKLSYGDFDSDVVIETKKQHPTLTWEQALKLSGQEPVKENAPSDSRSVGNVTGRERKVSGEKSAYTTAELTSLPHHEYIKVRELINKGKVKHIK